MRRKKKNFSNLFHFLFRYLKKKKNGRNKHAHPERDEEWMEEDAKNNKKEEKHNSLANK